ncbi:SH3 domain-containing YSC84-like protein 1 [Hyaloraphidium curvatum]|nr:SH3 domain-containing YSC84-like protein 1 [Hyaloraphidium curvatum]
MDKEAEKAAETINNMINPGKGIDIIVPKSIIDKAKAIAVLHIVKVAWGFSGRAGSGVIVAKLPDGTWSAPCAIGMAGAGWGAQVGVAVTDFMFIATTDAGVKAFSRGFNVQFGVNVAVALGPIGREGEVDIMLSDFAPVYTYSKTKGLFAGVSLEGSVLLQRSRANEAKYGKDVTGEMILTGKVPHPKGSESLYKALEEMDKRAAERAKAAAEKMKPTSEAPDF